MRQRRGLMGEIEWDSVASFVDQDPSRCTKPEAERSDAALYKRQRPVDR